MLLQITEKENVFYLNGSINFKTISFLSSYFVSIEKKTITLNIDNVKKIDKKGLNAIFVLLNNVHKTFSVAGYGCKDIYDQFHQNKVA
jgi:ABC-type transporter Mla MlaB component